MTRDQWLQAFNATPDAVQNYLLDPVSGKQEDTAQSILAYDGDAWNRVMDVVWSLLFQKLTKAEFAIRCKSVAGDRKPEDVEKILLQWLVLPLADLVSWDVESRLSELGLPTVDIQSSVRISLKPVSYGAAVRRVASLAKISLLNEEVVRKLRDAMVSYIKGVRTKEQLLEIMQRSQAEGGLGFALAQASTFVDEMEKFLLSTTVMSEQDFANWYRNYQQTMNAEEAAAAANPLNQSSKLSTEDEQVLPKRMNESAKILDESVEQAIAQIGHLELDDYLMKRLRSVISTRFRDVRNVLQIKDMLVRQSTVGGLGLNPEEAERISSIIETVYNNQRVAIVEEEKKQIEAIQIEQRKKIDERKQRESEEHAAWYKEKVAASKGDAAVGQLRAIMQTQPIPSAAQSAPMSAQKPSMVDIIPPVRLTGLSEELKNMDIDTFRRQAKTPDQAAEKIFQKLETLKRENFERWTEGIQSWRSSPLQQQYLKLVAESFSSAKPVAQLVEEKRKVDPNLPTAEELGAIISLNARIQF